MREELYQHQRWYHAKGPPDGRRRETDADGRRRTQMGTQTGDGAVSAGRLTGEGANGLAGESGSETASRRRVSLGAIEPLTYVY